MKNKLVTYICYSIITVFAMLLTSYSPLLKSISDSFSLTRTQSGVIFTANFIGFVVFILIGGVLGDKIGKKKIMLISLTGFGLCILAFPFSINFYAAFVIMIFIGGFGGIIETLVNAVISDINPGRETYYVNLTQVFFGIGAIIGPVAAGLIVSGGLPWQLNYYILGGLVILLSVLLYMVRMPKLNKVENISTKIFKVLFTDIRFLLICLCMFLYTGSEVGSWGWMSTYLHEDMNFSLVKSSIAVAAFWASMTVSRYICGYLSLKFSIRHIIIVLALLSTVFIILSGLGFDGAVLWVVIIGLGFSFSSLWPLIASYGGEGYKSVSATAFALLVGSGALGGTFIPYFMGVVGTKTNMQTAMISPSILLFTIAIIFALIHRIKPKSIR